MEHVEIHPDDLPENAVGYESVSAVVWFGAEPPSWMSRATNGWKRWRDMSAAAAD